MVPALSEVSSSSSKENVGYVCPRELLTPGELGAAGNLGTKYPSAQLSFCLYRGPVVFHAAEGVYSPAVSLPWLQGKTAFLQYAAGSWPMEFGWK